MITFALLFVIIVLILFEERVVTVPVIAVSLLFAVFCYVTGS